FVHIGRETLSLPRQARRWNDDIHRECRARHFLTVGAVANCRSQWFGTALVAHCPAKTATENLWHCSPPEISLHKIAKWDAGTSHSFRVDLIQSPSMSAFGPKRKWTCGLCPNSGGGHRVLS